MSEIHEISAAAQATTGVPSSSRGMDRGDFHLLAIGINDYLHWDRLTTAVKGAEKMAALLESEYGFSHVRMLIGKEATRRAIVGELARLVDTLQPEDSLLIYFAGHGHIDSRTKTGAWIPVDAEPAGEKGRYDASSTWLQNSLVLDHLKNCPANHILVVSDSCFAGDFLLASRGEFRQSCFSSLTPSQTPAFASAADTPELLAVRRLRSRQVLTAGALQPVSDIGYPGHSVFTGHLLRELREQPEPWLFPAMLHHRVRTAVANNAEQLPEFGVLYGTGDQGGEFIFFRQASRAKTALSTASESTSSPAIAPPLGRSFTARHGRALTAFVGLLVAICAIVAAVVHMQGNKEQPTDPRDIAILEKLTVDMEPVERSVRLRLFDGIYVGTLEGLAKRSNRLIQRLPAERTAAIRDTLRQAVPTIFGREVALLWGKRTKKPLEDVKWELRELQREYPAFQPYLDSKLQQVIEGSFSDIDTAVRERERAAIDGDKTRAE